jgi:hypothetical protein
VNTNSGRVSDLPGVSAVFVSMSRRMLSLLWQTQLNTLYEEIITRKRKILISVSAKEKRQNFIQEPAVKFLQLCYDKVE